MKILICPDKFKGSLEAAEVARAIAEGLSRELPGAKLVLEPLADGGEGTAEILRASTGGRREDSTVADPLGRPVPSFFAVLGDGRTAVVEMAAASGFSLLSPEERDPLLTSTFGTGQLISQALDAGLRRFIVAIGGSATNDGGMGMAAALGARFLSGDGESLEPRGSSLGEVASVDTAGLDPRITESEFVVACDVANPLLGPEGATRVYGPQKGAGPRQLDLLEAGMGSYARVVEKEAGRELASVPGTGAAGGLGFGLMAFLGARVEPGIEVVMRAVGFEDKARCSDLIITGEGRYDAQTSYGKTVAGVDRSARVLGKPLVVLAGAVAPEARTGALKEWRPPDGYGIGCFAVTPENMPLEEAMEPRRARENLARAAARLARLI